MIEKYYSNLREMDAKYSQLVRNCQIAVATICNGKNEPNLENYSAPIRAQDDELQFGLFGLQCFIRFRHNFDKGTIEYGVIVIADDNGFMKKIPVAKATFDRIGNLGEPYQMYPVEEFNKVHIIILASNQDAFRKAAYGTEDER